MQVEASAQRVQRSKDMIQLAQDTFQILEEAVRDSISDLRLEAFKLVAGKIKQSPFSGATLDRAWKRWFMLLGDSSDAAVVDDGQPFFLRALAQWLKRFQDPDAHWLTEVEDSFASGVYVGVDKPLPRSPQIFPRKLKQRRLDETDFVRL